MAAEGEALGPCTSRPDAGEGEPGPIEITSAKPPWGFSSQPTLHLQKWHHLQSHDDTDPESRSRELATLFLTIFPVIERPIAAIYDVKGGYAASASQRVIAVPSVEHGISIVPMYPSLDQA